MPDTEQIVETWIRRRRSKNIGRAFDISQPTDRKALKSWLGDIYWELKEIEKEFSQ